MSLRGWEKLACKECSSEFFIAVHRLTWHEGQGTANKQDAWKCAQCGAIASTAKMIDVIQKKHLQDKIKELEAQQSG